MIVLQEARVCIDHIPDLVLCLVLSVARDCTKRISGRILLWVSICRKAFVLVTNLDATGLSHVRLVLAVRVFSIHIFGQFEAFDLVLLD